MTKHYFYILALYLIFLTGLSCNGEVDESGTLAASAAPATAEQAVVGGGDTDETGAVDESVEGADTDETDEVDENVEGEDTDEPGEVGADVID